MRRRIIVPASQIRAVFVECRECGLQVVPGTKGGQFSTEKCPQCGTAWSAHPTSTQVAPAVNDLLTAVQRLSKSKIEVFVEFEAEPGVQA